jgi:hypothetical protein
MPKCKHISTYETSPPLQGTRFPIKRWFAGDKNLLLLYKPCSAFPPTFILSALATVSNNTVICIAMNQPLVKRQGIAHTLSRRRCSPISILHRLRYISQLFHPMSTSLRMVQLIWHPTVQLPSGNRRVPDLIRTDIDGINNLSSSHK